MEEGSVAFTTTQALITSLPDRIWHNLQSDGLADMPGREVAAREQQSSTNHYST